MSFRKNIIAILCAALLTGYTLYVALDTFVISRTYTAVDPPSVASESASASESGSESASASESSTPSESGSASSLSSQSASETVVTDTTYDDGSIRITLTEYRQYDTQIYVADVTVSSPDFLKTAFAENVYGRNVTEKTSAIASRCGAILAVNGDYYGAQTSGYVIRNGVLYREKAASGRQDLVIWKDGTFGIVSEDEVTAAALLEQGAEQVLSFGPALVENGTVSAVEGEEVGKAKASNPRTAIGVIDAGHYLFVVSDGRTSESAGLSLYQLAEFLQSLGAQTAYNLDGGGSSTMVFNGSVVNQPTTNGSSIKERSVSDIVYIG